MHTAKKDHWAPAGSTRTDTDHGAVYEYMAGARFAALVYAGKARKPTFHYSFKSAEQRADYLRKWTDGREARADMMARRKTERDTFAHTLKVGDMLKTCWGYEQTNVEFFEVVAVHGKHVMLREVEQVREENGYMSGRCAPLAGCYIGEPIRKKVLEGNNIKFASYRYASPCERIQLAPGVSVVPAARWSAYA